MRLVLARVRPPEGREVAPDLGVHLRELVGNGAVHHLAAESAKLILSVAPAELVTREPEIEASGDGSIEVAWPGRSQLTWVVRVPLVAWPGVNVRAFARDASTFGPLASRTFHQVFTLLEHANNHLE